MNLIGDFKMASNAGCATENTVPANAGAAGNANHSRHGAVLALDAYHVALLELLLAQELDALRLRRDRVDAPSEAACDAVGASGEGGRHGGGVVGASVLYHLAKFGWTDVALVERSILTAGSSWHAAGGIHALNADPNMAALQAYTIDLLGEIEKESGQSIGLHMTGGVTVASAPARWEWLQSAYRIFQTIGIEDCHLMTPEEVKAAWAKTYGRLADTMKRAAERTTAA